MAGVPERTESGCPGSLFCFCTNFPAKGLPYGKLSHQKCSRMRSLGRHDGLFPILQFTGTLLLFFYLGLLCLGRRRRVIFEILILEMKQQA